MTDAVPSKMVQDIIDLNKKFGFILNKNPTHLPQAILMRRFNFIQEELDEFLLAAKQQNMEEMADALVDIVYVAIGTAVMMGLPWDEMWDEVQRANMTKEKGRTHRGHDDDLVKPKWWVGPQHKQILSAHGYNWMEWFGEDGVFWEERAEEGVV